MTSTTNTKCVKGSFSSSEYKKNRDENIARIDDLYQKSLDDFSKVYNNYNQLQTAETPDPVLNNQRDQALMNQSPNLNMLNQKLIDIEDSLLKNNINVRKTIDEQEKELDDIKKDKKTIETKFNYIRKNLKGYQTEAETSRFAVKDIDQRYKHNTKWFYILLAINIILLIAFIILTYFIIFSSNSITKLSNKMNNNYVNM
jgi:hypothetical protein